jgi:hypothetical protein
VGALLFCFVVQSPSNVVDRFLVPIESMFGKIMEERGETQSSQGGDVSMLPRWARRVILTVFLTEVIRFLLQTLFQ